MTTLGNESTDFATVKWSPAVRQTTDNNGLPIKVYATTSSSFNSAIDLYNDSYLDVISGATRVPAPVGAWL